MSKAKSMSTSNEKALRLALEALKLYETAHDGMVNGAIKALEEALAKQEQSVSVSTECVGEPVAHWSDCAVHSEPAYPAGECDCGGYSPDKELLDSARVFYNATVADSQVRISSSSQEKRDAAFNASERLRFALLAKLKATDEDLKVYQSIADNYFKDTTPYVATQRQQRPSRSDIKPLTNENPLLVFAKECVLGAYSETELADAAFRAIEAALGIKE